MLHPTTASPHHTAARSSSSRPAPLQLRRRAFVAAPAQPRPSWRCHASSSSSSPGPPDINSWFSSSSSQPLQSFVGPVVPYRLKGVGLALEAATTLQPGETLLVTPPLALLQRSPVHEAAGREDDDGDSGSWLVPLDEEVEALADQLTAAAAGGAGDGSSSRVQAWLQHLDDGSLEHAQSAVLPDLAALTAAAPTTAASAAAAALSGDSKERLLDIADVNGHVLVQDELLQDDAAGSNAPSVGIWPELTLLRHSCSPNTTVLLHQTCAVVTASRGVPKNAPLHQNLLASEVFAPLQHRRALLRNLTGAGDCQCPRCRDEAKQDPQLLQLVANIHEACVQQVGPELELAVEADDEAALERLRDELAAFCEVVDAGFSKLGVRQQSQVWLQASLLRLYELAALVSAALGSPDAQLLQLLAALAAEVAPGCHEHLLWAVQFRSEVAADEDAAFDGSLASADKRCVTALQLRYGRGLTQQKCRELMAAASV